MNYLLSILICTLNDRKQLFERLLPLIDQPHEVQLLICRDNGEAAIGTKRNRLVSAAKGDFCCFIDDDDLVPQYYTPMLLEAIMSHPDIDAIGFRQEIHYNNQPSGTIDLTNRRPEDANTKPLMHLNPIRTEIAQSEKFPDSNLGEDRDWARRIAPKIKKEYFIPEVLYEYWYVSPCNRILDENTNAKRQARILKELGITK